MPLQKLLFLLVLLVGPGLANLSDTDSMDSETASQSDGGSDSGPDYSDPNINTPVGGHMGYPGGQLIPQPEGTRGGKQNQQRQQQVIATAATTKNSEKTVNMLQMTVTAIMQLGMIVGVAIMVGSLFMLMVWMEILTEKACEKYRKVFHKPEILPDIERLHPAELVGTFSRYK